jgi:hypothetical protein
MYLLYTITPKLHDGFYLRIFCILVSRLRHKTKKVQRQIYKHVTLRDISCVTITSKLLLFAQRPILPSLFYIILIYKYTYTRGVNSIIDLISEI